MDTRTTSMASYSLVDCEKPLSDSLDFWIWSYKVTERDGSLNRRHKCQSNVTSISILRSSEPSTRARPLLVGFAILKHNHFQAERVAQITFPPRRS
jgi:hypothetical protein